MKSFLRDCGATIDTAIPKTKTIELKTPVIVVVGPTASGKSALAQELALTIDGEIISADSMQIYQGMDIGTGKLKKSEMQVAHHGLNLCRPDESYSASLFQTYARECFAEIDSREKRNILCGGTGLYIRAAIDDYHFLPGEQIENPVREKYTEVAETLGAQTLWDMLHERDPESAALLHPNNVRRVVRAFEMLAENTTYAQQHANLRTIKQLVPAVFIGLEVEPEILRTRISRRVDAMLGEGLLDEVKTLLDHGFRQSITSPQAIGYKELVPVIEEKTSLEKACDDIKTATCRYAKRQRTWFRSDSRIKWINADSGDVDALLCQAIPIIGKAV